MIVVSYDLISAISAERDESLGRVEIANDGTSVTSARGNYDVRLYSRGESPRIIRRARVENYPRDAQPAWRLIAAAFAALEAS